VIREGSGGAACSGCDRYLVQDSCKQKGPENRSFLFARSFFSAYQHEQDPLLHPEQPEASIFMLEETEKP
jgi:hypothetical protein